MSVNPDDYLEPFKLANEDTWYAQSRIETTEYGFAVHAAHIFALDEFDFPWEMDVETGDLRAVRDRMEE